MQKRNKGGFALAETIIALAVILMVSAAALTMILSTLLVKAHGISDAEAYRFASDTWECFKVSDKDEQFLDNLKFAFGEELPTDRDVASNVYQYRFDRFDAKIEVDEGFTELSVTVTDKKGEEILSISYQKGTGGGV
jgi:Tfp pilus assembly protein PilV